MNQSTRSNVQDSAESFAGESLFSDLPYKVADISPRTVAFGRKEIELAGFQKISA